MNLTSIPIISIALSIIICWALFALLCSYTLETFVQVKAERGRFMKTFLLQQLQDFPNGINWASLLYMHGSIDLLSRSANKPTSDIPPRLFAETLIECVANSHVVSMLRDNAIRENQYTPHYSNRLLNDFKIAATGLQQSDVVSFFRQALQSAELSVATSADKIPAEVEIYAKLVQNLEAWYSTFGDRMTLWYKKRTKKWLFYLGIFAAIAINVDSIELFVHFKSSPEARNAMISYYEKNKETLNAYADKLKTTADTVNTATDEREKDLIKRAKAVYALRDSLKLDSLVKSAELPIGWGTNRGFLTGEKDMSRYWIIRLLLKIAGLLLMGLAASMGAPFWFDVLKKLYSKPA